MKQRKWSLYIDKLTNSLEETASGASRHTEILKLQKEDLRIVTRTNGWHFNWRKELNTSGTQVYKLLIKDDLVIQGLISIEDKQDHLFLPLIETAPHNYGKQKKYKGVLGNLTAFACKKAFESGYCGEVAFIAKTKLIKHYEKELGAVILAGQRMGIYEETAKYLVSLYFKDFTP